MVVQLAQPCRVRYRRLAAPGLEGSRVRVVVDLELCQGHAVCESEAPEVFAVPKHGKVALVAERPGEEHRAEVAAAVAYCPTHAISIEED